MSWQAFIDQSLVGTGNVSQGAIYGLEGALWAQSAGFQLSPTELNELVTGFSDPSKVQAGGVHLNGVKYLTLRADDRSIYVKQGANGACIVKTNKALVIGTYKEGIQPGSCTKVVEGLADHLIGTGY
ncbi:profilin [Chlamydoabsidia padenii]|nr:profilin [Chlamydoabsidia padenii]